LSVQAEDSSVWDVTATLTLAADYQEQSSIGFELQYSSNGSLQARAKASGGEA
jgi:hypothetical protein